MNRSGFSRLDVLVILAILALLTINLPPFLVWSRELARRQVCAARLRQIGWALHNYYSTQNSLPPAAYWTAEGEDIAWIYESQTTPRVTHQNWALLLLPYLDQAALASQIDPLLPIAHPRHAALRTEMPSLFSCPSDSFRRTDNPYALEMPDGSFCRFARGNYAINGGSHRDHPIPCNPASPCPNGFHYEFDAATRDFRWYGTGIAGINQAFRWSDFQNGLSTTVACEEVRAGVDPLDSRGVWALGQIGGSITWAHGVSGDDFCPNNRWARSDDILGCGKLTEKLGEKQLVDLGMPCCPYCRWNAQATARSMHPGGVNVLMLDGSSRFIVDTINPSVWHVIHSREVPAEWLEPDFHARLKATEPHPPGTDKFDTVNGYDLPQIEHSPPAGQLRPEITNSLGSRFAWIPSGEFIMGLPDAGNDHFLSKDVPAHRVRITRSFYLGVFEVTQAEFEQVMGHNPSWHCSTGEGKHLVAGQDTGRFPVENVTWFEGVEFCRKLSDLPAERAAGRSYRLPTEAEWEYACRTGKRTPYRYVQQIEAGDVSGENAGKNNKMKDRGIRAPLPITRVGSYPPNEWGLHDMRGNVWEWCQDWFARDYYRRSPVDDPQGPETGFLRVVRGSDWIFVGEECKIDRVTNEPFRKSPFIGFRIVCEMPLESLDRLPSE